MADKLDNIIKEFATGQLEAKIKAAEIAGVDNSKLINGRDLLLTALLADSDEIDHIIKMRYVEDKTWAEIGKQFKKSGVWATDKLKAFKNRVYKLHFEQTY